MDHGSAMNRHIIGLTGRAGCGKDTVADFLVETHGFIKLAFADPLRDGAKAMLGLTDEELSRRENKEALIEWLGCSPRHVLQTLGTEWGRELIHPDLWLRITERRVERVLAMPPCQHINGIVLSDVRFENEADWVRRIGGTVWNINRPRAGLFGDSARHVSEQSLPIHEADLILHNTGDLDQLFDLATFNLDIRMNRRAA